MRWDWAPTWSAQLTGGKAGRAAMVSGAAIVEAGAKRRAAVSPDGSNGRPPGHMRDTIDTKMHRDQTAGWYADVRAPARTRDGHAYPLDVELGTKPHEIRSRGPWPLRNRRTGQVFGPVVHHPGTVAQPFLRPALYDLAGRILQ